MLFYEDKRTPEERRRDMETMDKMRANTSLSIGFAEHVLRPVLDKAGVAVGLVGKDAFGAELLVKHGDVTYKLMVVVSHDQE